MNHHVLANGLSCPMIQPFPKPGPSLRLAYRELEIAASDDPDAKTKLGPVADLPRPWIPDTCRATQLRTELWEWLEAVVVWLNHEYVFDTIDMIPACWARHPHLVHEIAVLADQRRDAGLRLRSDTLEEWHRYALPAFIERMKQRTKKHCDERHSTWPAKARFASHLDDPAVNFRQDAYRGDAATLTPSTPAVDKPPREPQLRVVVNQDTGEILD